MSTRASAARYASALFDVATKEANPEQAEKELTEFADLLPAHAELQKVLLNPAVPAASKRAVMEQLMDRQRPSSPVRKLLLLLAERDRLELVPDLVDVYRARLREHLKVVTAEVTTAGPLAPEEVAGFQQRLAASTGRTVTMTTKVDPSIIGGVVTRIGSTVYDGSLAAQLAALRQRLSDQR
jgi:F-type H+-transporting ATPase subunit delta